MSWDASGSGSGWLCLSLYVFSCACACVSLASLPPSLPLLCFSLLLFLSFLTHTEKQTVTGGPSSRSRRIMHAASPVVPLRSRGLPRRNAQLKPPKPHMSLFAKPVTAKPEKAPPPESLSENVRPKHGCQSQKGKIRHQSDTSPSPPSCPVSALVTRTTRLLSCIRWPHLLPAALPNESLYGLGMTRLAPAAQASPSQNHALLFTRCPLELPSCLSSHVTGQRDKETREQTEPVTRQGGCVSAIRMVVCSAANELVGPTKPGRRRIKAKYAVRKWKKLG